MTLKLERIQSEIEECDKCTDTSKCQNHKMLFREERRRRHELADPQRNRIGVRGDPTPDREYGR